MIKFLFKYAFLYLAPASLYAKSQIAFSFDVSDKYRFPLRMKAQLFKWTTWNDDRNNNLFSIESMLECSSHSSSVLSCLDERIRWWPVKHRVPSTIGMKGRWRITPSTLGVFINSANSISRLDRKQWQTVQNPDLRGGSKNGTKSYGKSYTRLTVTATTVVLFDFQVDFGHLVANLPQTRPTDHSRNEASH